MHWLMPCLAAVLWETSHAEFPDVFACPKDETPAFKVVDLLPDFTQLTISLFEGIADRDLDRVNALLDAGVDPNATLPNPPPDGFAKRFEGSFLYYYLAKETGVTALMFAAGMGSPDIVRALLDRGAERFRLTKRHKTYALQFAAKAKSVEAMRMLMGVAPESEPTKVWVHVQLSRQAADVWKDGQLLMTTRISSGRKNYATPTGEFVVTHKYKDWTSTIYDAKMPYYLRLSCGAFGLHAGVVPGYPASHGCVRLPPANAKKLYEQTPLGALVRIDP